MASDIDPYSLTSPWVFLWRMIVFLIIISMCGAFLSEHIVSAFFNNPSLNGLILGVGIIGILLTFRQIIRLFPEISWVNGYRLGDPGIETRAAPSLLAPMATLLGNKVGDRALSPIAMRSIMDSIETRLDEAREINRYLVGLLVFLGLLGTFWGLLQTINAVGETIQSLNTDQADSSVIFEELKAGLEAPLSGMGIAFSSSLFGLAGSLALGFMDLQAGQAQNRFYTELEDWLSSVTEIETEGEDTAGGKNIGDLTLAINQLRHAVSDSSTGPSRLTGTAIANLVEGIQNLVQLARSEQQMMREWVDEQSLQQGQLRKLLDSISREFETKGRR